MAFDAPFGAVRTEQRVLDFDIENRPLTYLGQDFTTAEITAIAASFGSDEPVKVWLLGRDDPRQMHDEFLAMYMDADVVTGHYIRMHDLPIINGARLEMGLRPLPQKLTCDTKMDLVSVSGVSKSQESLADMLGVPAHKVHMPQVAWRAANRLEHVELAEERVISDVRQHQLLRLRLLELGMLRAPRQWSVGIK